MIAVWLVSVLLRCEVVTMDNRFVSSRRTIVHLCWSTHWGRMLNPITYHTAFCVILLFVTCVKRSALSVGHHNLVQSA